MREQVHDGLNQHDLTLQVAGEDASVRGGGQRSRCDPFEEIPLQDARRNPTVYR